MSVLLKAVVSWGSAPAGPTPSVCPPAAMQPTCFWAGQVKKGTQLANFSCATDSDCAATCCQQCIENAYCATWTVWGPGSRDGYRCYLTTNTFEPNGNTSHPPAVNCTSGVKPLPPPPPTVPPPKNAKNVLMIVVDDMRAQMNVAYGQKVRAH